MLRSISRILSARAEAGGLQASFRALWPFTTGFRPLLAAMVAVGLLVSLVESVAVSLVTFLIYSLVAGPEAVSLAGSALPRALRGLERILDGSVTRVVLVIGATVLLRAGLSSLYGVLTALVRNGVHDRVRRGLFDQYLSLSYGYIATKNLGELTNSLQVEAWRVSEFVEHCARIVVNLCAVLVFSAVLVALSWPVALAAAICGALFLGVVQISRNALRELGRRATAVNEALAEKMFTSIESLRTIRALGLEAAESGTFARLSHEVRRLFVKVAMLDGAFRPVLDLLALLMLAVVVWLSYRLGDSPAATLTLVALIYRLQPHIRDLQGQLIAIFSLEAALATVVDGLKMQGRPYPPVGRRAFTGLRQEISFETVSFRHLGVERPSLSGASFRIPRGATFALLGGSGAGKTTVVNLLLKLYEPTEGVIRVDGVPLSDIERSSWLARTVITGQDIELLEGTLLDNLRLLAPDASLEQVRRALDLAGVLPFIDSLPDGLDTRVGQRGLRLSGGQRQRISLARALLAEPDILILDEATNAVESALESRVQRNIRAAFPGITIILIAHRSSALEAVDVSVRLEAGRVVDTVAAPVS